MIAHARTYAWRAIPQTRHYAPLAPLGFATALQLACNGGNIVPLRANETRNASVYRGRLPASPIAAGNVPAAIRSPPVASVAYWRSQRRARGPSIPGTKGACNRSQGPALASASFQKILDFDRWGFKRLFFIMLLISPFDFRLAILTIKRDLI
jgi:hypothetical protein